MIDVKTRVIDSPALTEGIYSAYQLSRPLVAFIGPFSDKCRVDREDSDCSCVLTIPYCASMVYIVGPNSNGFISNLYIFQLYYKH